jgi:hypothetical protein
VTSTFSREFRDIKTLADTGREAGALCSPSELQWQQLMEALTWSLQGKGSTRSSGSAPGMQQPLMMRHGCWAAGCWWWCKSCTGLAAAAAGGVAAGS